MANRNQMNMMNFCLCLKEGRLKESESLMLHEITRGLEMNTPEYIFCNNHDNCNTMSRYVTEDGFELNLFSRSNCSRSEFCYIYLGWTSQYHIAIRESTKQPTESLIRIYFLEVCSDWEEGKWQPSAS